MTDDDIKEMIPYLDVQARIALIESRLGKVSDGDLAKLIEVDRKNLRNARIKLDIKAFTLPGYMKKLDRNKIKSYLEQGMSDEQIAIKLKCSAGQIGCIRREEFEIWTQGGPQRNVYRKHNWAQIEKLSEAMGATAIAQQLGISVHSVHTILRKIKYRKGKNANQK